MTSFKDLKLAPSLQSALDALGYTTPTPIQLQCIPQVIEGCDLMGIAQTGTGKTAAFALPSLHHICKDDRDPPKRGARVLVLAPTRELASQIAVSYRDYGRKIEHLSVACVFGGVPISRQIKKLVKGNDALVATPGRLIDLLDRGAITLKDIEILILDEADQMMDMGFIHALKKIIPLLPEERQTLFFSATMVPAIKKLAGQFLTDPVTVSVTPANTTAERVSQSVTFVEKHEKQDLLALSLLEEAVNRALVFTRTKHGADRVVKRLAATGLRAVAIHGNKSQGQRQRALQAFRDGDVTILVATDIAARGIDIEDISHVFNYEIPNVPEQYVHRIGRTARAGREGKAVAFVAKDERKYFKEIQKLLDKEIPVIAIPEDFNNKAKALSNRPALPPEPKPVENQRKGRGKSKKKNKGRFTKSNKASPEGERRETRPDKPSQKEQDKTPKQKVEKPKRQANSQAQPTAKHDNKPKTKKRRRKTLAEIENRPKKPHERYGSRRKTSEQKPGGKPQHGKPKNRGKANPKS